MSIIVVTNYYSSRKYILGKVYIKIIKSITCSEYNYDDIDDDSNVDVTEFQGEDENVA